MYAPLIRALGVDIARRCLRKRVPSKSVLQNSLVPLHPEICGYIVCEIKKGNGFFLVF